ncbi:hypothetical protein B0H12DRAFT_96310 [Mycena haematopus]|nr:hypothetical protein B0H12DRAFT_96310 [Mycena haematopus]
MKMHFSTCPCRQLPRFLSPIHSMASSPPFPTSKRSPGRHWPSRASFSSPLRRNFRTSKLLRGCALPITGQLRDSSSATSRATFHTSTRCLRGTRSCSSREISSSRVCVRSHSSANCTSCTMTSRSAFSLSMRSSPAAGMSCVHPAARRRKSLRCGVMIPPLGHASSISKGSRRCKSGPCLTCQTHPIYPYLYLPESLFFCPTSVAQKVLYLPFLPPLQLTPSAPLRPPRPLGRETICYREPAHSSASERARFPTTATASAPHLARRIPMSRIGQQRPPAPVRRFDGAGLV